MFTVSDTIHINAPIERCFLLATHIELTAKTVGTRVAQSKTTAIAGRGDRVTWSRDGLWRPAVYESEITRYERPEFFQDRMVRGRFKRLEHDHHFVEIDGHTLLTDKLRFSLPMGWVGKKVGKRLVVPRVAKTLRRRLETLKQVAESNEWRQYLADEPLPRNTGDGVAARAS